MVAAVILLTGAKKSTIQTLRGLSQFVGGLRGGGIPFSLFIQFMVRVIGLRKI